MDHQSSKGLQQFKNYVGIKFQLYNSLFTSLPFHRIEKTGILLSMLLNNCEEGYRKKQSPVQIIEEFFEKHTSYTKEQDKVDLLFRFIQLMCKGKEKHFKMRPYYCIFHAQICLLHNLFFQF